MHNKESHTFSVVMAHTLVLLLLRVCAAAQQSQHNNILEWMLWQQGDEVIPRQSACDESARHQPRQTAPIAANQRLRRFDDLALRVWILNNIFIHI